jgi:voltage-gated potassium channel
VILGELFSTLGRPAGLFLMIVVVGTAGLMLLEPLSLIDALWFVVGTLLTVGLGEPHGPMGPAGRVFTIALIASGVGVAGYAVAQFGQVLADGRVLGYLRERRRRMHIGELRDHFVVIGFGRLGREVVMDLHAHGHRVVVIDTAEALLAHAEPHALPVLGDASSDAVLQAARVPFAKGVAIATPSSPLNVYLTLAVRQLNPSAYIVARIDDRDAASKATRCGADALVSPFSSGGGQMAQKLAHPAAAQFLEQVLGRDFPEIGLGDVTIPAGSSLAGTIGALQLRERFGVTVIAIRQADGSLLANPTAKDTLLGGAIAIVVGPQAGIRRLRESL